MKNNWKIMTLGEVCNFRRGLTYSKKDEVSLSKNAVLRANNIDLQSNTLIFDEIRYISDDIVIPQSKKLVKNSVIICTASGSRLHLGKVAFIDKDYDYAFGGFMGLLVPDTKIINPRYFFTILTSGQFRDHVNSLTAGANINNLKFNQIDGYEIVVPPISEQERIVKILDEAFEKIDRAKAFSEKNLQKSKDLFDSYSESIFSDRDNLWPKQKLSEVCLVERGSSPRPIIKYFTDESDGVNWIKIGDTKNVDRYLYSTRQKITKAGAEKSRKVEDGDLILSNSMSFGKPYIMKTTGYIHDGWFVLRPNANIDTEYFYDVISSPQVQKQFVALASGSVVKNISGDLTKRAILPIPSLKEQKAIVKKLHSLFEQTKKLEAKYRQKIADLDELKKSVLSKAFAGEL